MLDHDMFTHSRVKRPGFGLLCMFCLVVLMVPGTALAAPMTQDYTGPEKCVLCHLAEAQAWQDSPHATALSDIDEAHQQGCTEAGHDEDCTCLTCHTTDFDRSTRIYAAAGVTCEACHGPYVEGHPGEGVMRLDVDSSVCSDCHAETHVQWQGTSHADAGVQCIGCHKSHSQELRLTDEQLCVSCHRDQLLASGHRTHNLMDLRCIDCHSSPVNAVGNQSVSIAGAQAPDHDFAVVPEVCSGCHSELFQADRISALAAESEAVHLVAEEGEQRAEALDCVAAEEARRSAPALAAASLGLGLGMGGMIGVVSVLAIGYVVQWRRRK